MESDKTGSTKREAKQEGSLSSLSLSEIFHGMNETKELENVFSRTPLGPR